MGSSMVNYPVLQLGIIVYLGIWLNGKTYAAPNKDDCEDCQETYPVKPNSISNELRNVLNEMKKIETMENELLEEMKTEADDQKNKPELMNSFLEHFTGNKKQKEANEIDDYDDKPNGKKQKEANEIDDYDDKPNGSIISIENTEDEEVQIYLDLWGSDKDAQGCISHHLGESGTIHFSNAELTGNWRRCLWTINTTVSAFEITFHNFSMNSCERLIIGDGISLLPIAILRGYSVPGSIRLPHVKAYILFISLCQSRTAEFALQWNSSESGCNSLFNNDYGVMHHPARNYSSISDLIHSNHIYSNNENCSWVIKSSKPLHIRFSRFSTEGCCDFLYVRDGITSKSDVLAILRGNSAIPSFINTTSNGVHLQFTSDYSNVGTGFTMVWHVHERQVDCGGIYSTESGTIRHPATPGNNYKNNQNCTWIINSAVALEISFESFNTERCCDHLYVRDGNSRESPTLGRFSGNTLPTTLRTTRDAHIQFISDRSVVKTGFLLHWNTSASGGHSECSYHFNNDSGIIEYPLTNDSYPNNANCSWVIVSSGASIELNFTRFNTELCCDIVYIRDGDTSKAPQLGRYSGNNLPSSVRTTRNKAFISFTSDFSITRRGFALTWIKVGCGAVYNNDTGSINHPATGGNYQNNENCTWIIRASSRINITFARFDTERGYDFLYIRDGESVGSPVLRFSGSVIPRSFQTRTNTAHLRFTSDRSIKRKGFALHWTSLECGGNYGNDSGVITFPQNGSLYDNNQHCVWIIETTGPFIEFSFENFRTERNYDTLTIRDGNNSGSPVVGIYSGRRVPSPLRTATSKAYLSFTSDSSIVRNGFVIHWNAADAEGYLNCTCGSVNSNQEIVGGEEVEYEVKYPWHVGLFSNRSSSFYFCGGTLISDKYVLTAAHCVFPRYPHDLMIRIGDHIRNNITEDIEGVTEAISVENVFIHPRYYRRRYINDFALLRLSRSITFTDDFGIRPICLPQISLNNTFYSNYTGELGLAVGWGTMRQGTRLMPDTLRQVEMTILPPECNGWSAITPAMLCAFTEGKDTCQGDSGGSLAVFQNVTDGNDGSTNASTYLTNGSDGSTNEYYVLVGVTSWGMGCAARTPGVYSRVTTALHWIQRFAVICNRRGPAP